MTAFSHRVTLRWSDYDPLQHVNNVRYFEFMQDARVGLLESLAVDRAYLTTVGHFVAHNEIDYLVPMGMDLKELFVKVWVIKSGGASYDLGYEFVDEAGTIFAKAKTVMVTVDTATQTVVRIPEDFRDLLTAVSQ